MRSLLVILFIKTIFAHGIDWNGKSLTNRCDFPGNDLTNITEAEPQNCANRCYSTKECTHYTWTNFNGGTCWLKRGEVTKSDASGKDDEGAVCGVGWDSHGIEWNGNTWARWCDFYGNDLSNATTKSKDCYNRCVNTTGCTHFTWTNYNDGTCWMKKGSINRMDAFPKYDEGAVCGMTVDALKMVWRNWHGYSWFDGCDFEGNNLKTVTIAYQECVDLCFSTPRCTHLTYLDHPEKNQNICSLKKGTVEKSDAKSAGKTSRCVVFGTHPVVLSGRSTRYWDCCKPACAWKEKALVTNPVSTCAEDGDTVITNSYTQSGCNGGTAYMCNKNIPWAVNDTVSFGFAAAHIINQTEADWCCKCYHLTFTSPLIKGKKMVVQVTGSTSRNDWENHFALQIPGGGVGDYLNGCSSQWGAPIKGWGGEHFFL